MNGPSIVKTQVSDEGLVQRRRAQIVEAAVELFSRNGFHRTTIMEVAALAGVSSGLIYQYVSDKEDVLLLALLSILESYKREIPLALEGLTDPLERFLAAVTAYCRIIDKRREATVLAYRSTKSLPPDRRRLIKDQELETNELIAGCLRDGIAQGLFRAVNVDLMVYQLVSFAHNWALKYWRLKEICGFEDYVGQGMDVYVRALLTRKGWARYRKLHPTSDREAGS